ncbi:hypothetical protein D1871_12890 [Nakamurella silvestris]|nr:hypothetical protein D1871_12890 [Nakamurella silvestris]
MKLDPFAQRRLLDLAAADQALGSARHRRQALPELAVIEAGTEKATALRGEALLAETEVADLKRAMNKLELEIDQVRGRARRDADRLASGSASAKELENLQHEIESLTRRQGVLEDEELELMEQREEAEVGLTALHKAEAELKAELDAASARRDEAFAEIDAEASRQEEKRRAVSEGLPAEVLALYNRIHDSGKIAAAQLAGARCGACRIEIDRTALSEIRAVPVDGIARCSECGAILIRS